MDKNKLPIAHAHYGFRRIVVERCPYCEGTHYHNEPVSQGDTREADCFKGQYIIVFSDSE